MWTQILTGLGAGIVYGVIGFAKNLTSSNPNDWDWAKFGATAVVCAVVGGFAAYEGTDYGIMVNSIVAVGSTEALTKVVKTVWNYFAKKRKK